MAIMSVSWWYERVCGKSIAFGGNGFLEHVSELDEGAIKVHGHHVILCLV
jgi:hypothetical protein